jgi:hypothetical protein
LGACLARAGEFSAARGRPLARSSTCSRRRSCLRKNGPFFEWFPYVCPEPVLVKCSVLYINGSKRPFLLTVLCHRVVPLPERHPPATIPHNHHRAHTHTHTTHTHAQCTHNAHTQRTQRTQHTHRKRKVRQCGVRYCWNSPFAQASRAEGKESRTA